MPERTDVVRVQLRDWADRDLELLRRNNAPEMTEQLGGPESEEKLLDRHRRYLAIRGTGTGRMFVVALLPDLEPVGSIGYWDHENSGGTVYEAGWGVLPEYQGRGIAAAAARAAIDSARGEHKHRYLHAYPKVTNLPSNALCRRLGFELLGEFGFEYPAGNPIRCNDWRVDLGEPPQA